MPLVIQRDKREIGGENVPALERFETLGKDFHAHFHARAPDAVDGGLKDQDVAMSRWTQETNRVDAKGNADSSRVALGDDGRHAVGQIEHAPTKESAEGIE